MADQHTTRARENTPPAPGDRPSVRVDRELSEDFAVLMSTGLSKSDAIREAVRQLAAIYRTGWAHGVCPPGTAPTLLAYQLEQQPVPAHGRPTPPPGRGVGRPVPPPPAHRRTAA